MTQATPTAPRDTRPTVAGHPLPWKVIPGRYAWDKSDFDIVDASDDLVWSFDEDELAGFWRGLVEDVNRLGIMLRASLMVGDDVDDTPWPAARQTVADDTERLDWLDRQTDAMNRGYGTIYGWKFYRSHNGMNLADSNLPALTIRQAIDTERFPGRALEILRGCDRETKRRQNFRKAFPGVSENAGEKLAESRAKDAEPFAETSNADLSEMLEKVWLRVSPEYKGVAAQAIQRLDRIAALEAALVEVASFPLPDSIHGHETRAILRNLGLAHRLEGNPDNAEQVTA